MDRKAKEKFMKTRKVLALAGVTLLAAGVLAACSGGTASKAEKTFAFTYETHPDNLNYLITGKAATADITSNVIDGLLENDKYGNLIPSMAEDWSVSKDGLTYTYKIRQDAKWYTSEGEEYAPVKAQDFVTGLKYWYKIRLKVWMPMLKGKIKISLKLELKPLTIKQSNTL